MHIVADENLALLDYFFADVAQIHQFAGRRIRASDLTHADALLVRSVTAVNAALLQSSPLRFVGSATIGTDHLDLPFLQQQAITWANAPGCNAQAVAEYVISAILSLQPQQLYAGQQFCLGIVGLGNVGKRLAHLAQLLGWRVCGHDPAVQLQGIENASLQHLLQQSDAVSLHVPLTKSGDHPTYHLMNQQTLACMPPHAMLINSARGAVVSQAALMQDIAQTGRAVVLDVFEFEPEIPVELLDQLALATPHIAGYSMEGKAKGTQMIYEAFCQKFALTACKDYRSQLQTQPDYFSGKTLHTALECHLTQIYDIRVDDQALRSCVQQAKVDANAFDALRKNYPLRREWAAFAGP